MSQKQRLILFTRLPQPGMAKTRLIPRLGPEGAAELQRAMTEHTLHQARKTGVPIEVRYTGGTAQQMREWLGGGLDYAEQGDGDLGDRMLRAFREHFGKGIQQAVLVGSDCPSMDSKIIDDAFHALQTHEGVIGPTHDGGYYLIGLDRAGFPCGEPPEENHFPAGLFRNKDWGGAQVLEQTLRAAAGHAMVLLPCLSDVDLPEDLPEKISVIIPALNEEEYLAQTLERVHEGFNVEILVVDGGSTDGTRALLKECLICPDGRAGQQNLGAREASGDILLFLHADTILPDGWDRVVRDTLSDPAVALGAFTFRIKEPMRGMKFIEDTANWRSRRGRLPYGDQGLFLRRDTFEEAGGFPDLPIMEDYAFVRSLRRRGRIVTVPEAALTSGRRWRRYGVFRVTVINKLMILGYHLGIPIQKLAAFYRRR